MMTTKIFNNGNSQAVRIPKEYRFEQEDVIISKVGSAVLLYQRGDRLSVLMESLNLNSLIYSIHVGRKHSDLAKT